MGGIAAMLLVLLTFPMLVELTRPLHLLSTTGLAAILIFTWLFAWAVISAARERISTAFA